MGNEQQHDESKKVPEHVGLILDGNRRWARAKGLPLVEGHKVGYQALKKIVQSMQEKGIKYLSAYIFSTENWNRSQDEVKYLMNLTLWVAKHEIKELAKNNVRVRFLGTDKGVEPKVLKALRDAEERSKDNTGGTLALCFNYGGQLEIVDAVRSMMKSGIDADQVTPEEIAKHLYDPDIPPIDLVVRTSGEQRISNFMLWRAAYAEFSFIQKNWPDFTVDDLDEVLEDYANRQRRFGK